MTSCNGVCLIRCMCYNEKTYEYNEVCDCGNREHYDFCILNSSIPSKCRNYKYCNVKVPRWVLLCNNGMCMNCFVKMGKHKYTNEIGYCCVCLEDKVMLILKCNHKVCNECWYTITKENCGNGSLCPLCRNLNDHIKLN